MRHSDQVMRYIHYYELAKKVNFWSIIIRFFAGLTMFGVISIFISLFYKRSIDFTFHDHYNSKSFAQFNLLYIAILVTQVLKLALILIYNTIACISGFIKTPVSARRNYMFGKITIIIYTILLTLDTFLCLTMYSKVSVRVFIEPKALKLFLLSVFPSMMIVAGYWILICIINAKYHSLTRELEKMIAQSIVILNDHEEKSTTNVL